MIRLYDAAGSFVAFVVLTLTAVSGAFALIAAGSLIWTTGAAAVAIVGDDGGFALFSAVVTVAALTFAILFAGAASAVVWVWRRV